MIYVYNKPPKNRIPGSSIVKIVFGGLLTLLTILSLILALSPEGGEEQVATGIAYTIIIAPGAFLLLFFGIRGILKSSKAIATRNFSNPPINNPVNPFFTTTCAVCGTTFDYQKSDLGYRAWFANGFVPCPDCKRPTRHNAIVNTYYTGNDPNYKKTSPANFPQQGYPQQNVNQQNFPQHGYPQQNVNQQNFPQQGYPQQNVNQQNFPQQSYPQTYNNNNIDK